MNASNDMKNRKRWINKKLYRKICIRAIQGWVEKEVDQQDKSSRPWVHHIKIEKHW